MRRVKGKLFTCGNITHHKTGQAVELQSDLNGDRYIAIA
jgi:hypothetical protein